MVNTARDFAKEWNVDRCGVTITRTMVDAGYTGWLITKHHQWHAGRQASWDETSLDMTGFRTPEEYHGQDQGDVYVPFESLATSVRRMPEDGEALDLTRMVQYCAENPTESWLYPRDYDELLDLLGGPLQVRDENFDRLAFERWDEVKPPAHRTWSAEEEEAARQALGSKYPKKKYGNKTLGTTGSGVQSRQSTPSEGVQPKNGRRTKKYSRLEEADTDENYIDEEAEMAADEDRDEEEAEYSDNEADKETQKEIYIRPTIEYVAAPEGATAPTPEAIHLAFDSEGNFGQTNPFSPYAFDESRLTPPYRMLHDVELPHETDVSGWAENLRWAFEQRAYYRDVRHVEGWNESPEHMELIGQIRQTRLWASDELIAHVSRLQEEDEEVELFETWAGVRW
jgi:hypothetical protein